jgi:hypothetical protein
MGMVLHVTVDAAKWIPHEGPSHAPQTTESSADHCRLFLLLIY